MGFVDPRPAGKDLEVAGGSASHQYTQSSGKCVPCPFPSQGDGVGGEGKATLACSSHPLIGTRGEIRAFISLHLHARMLIPSLTYISAENPAPKLMPCTACWPSHYLPPLHPASFGSISPNLLAFLWLAHPIAAEIQPQPLTKAVMGKVASPARSSHPAHTCLLVVLFVCS